MTNDQFPINTNGGTPFGRLHNNVPKAHIHWYLLVIGIYWSLTATVCFAQSAFDPSVIDIGARSLGMGGAYVAAEDDVNNPAGLGEVDSMKYSSQAGNLLEEVNYTALGGIYPLGEKAAVGLSYTGAFVSGIELRDSLGNLSSKANYGSSVAILSYGRKLTDKFSLGASLKYFFTDGSENDGGDGKGWSVDLGLLQSGWDWLSLGLVGQNLLGIGSVQYQNGATESFSPKLKAGSRVYLFGGRFGSAFASPYELSLSLDGDLYLQGSKSVTLHSGVEFSPNPMLTLRAGLDESNLTAGVSLKISGLGLHYAYHPYGGFAENNAHFFSITFDERGWPPSEDTPSDAFIAKK